MNRITLFAVSAAFSLTSLTASGATVQPREEISRWGQISSAAWPLAQANVELCGQTTGPALGFTQVGSMENRPMIFGVGEGSPAAASGLKDFDELVAFNGKALQTRKLEQVTERFDEVFADEAEVGQPLQVTYLRDGAEATVEVTPVNACKFNVMYIRKPIPTTTQGTALLLGNAIDSYASSPLEIRTYVSRYLARVILDHQGQNQKQGRKFDLLSGAAGLLTGHQAPVTGNAFARFRNGESQDLEQDYLSVYLLARAGDDVSGVPLFWEGVFANMTGNRFIGRALGQSQASPERLQELTAARDEVLAKVQAGQELKPEGRRAGQKEG
jgi:hypothetical protein